MMRQYKWSNSEKRLARAVFERAYERECQTIAAEIRSRASSIDSPGDIWRIEEYLRQKRRETDEKYDYRYSVLLDVFARLIIEGWMSLDELSGLADDKLARIRFFVEMAE